MPKIVVRRFDAFAMHAHHDTNSTYADLFAKFAALPRGQRIFRTGDLVCGFPIVEPEGTRYFVRAVEGDVGTEAFVLDTATGRTRENILADTEVLTQATHFVVHPAKRRAAIEFVRRGAKSNIIAQAIEGILRENHRDLRNMRLEFAPIVREGFVRDIATFERIRQAGLRVTKPNASWSDHYTSLSNFLEESKGEKAEVDVRAGRNETLSKTSGIVGAIKDVVSDAQPYLDEAYVRGTRKDEVAETTIRASNNIEHTKARVEADEAGVASADDIKRKLLHFLTSL